MKTMGSFTANHAIAAAVVVGGMLLAGCSGRNVVLTDDGGSAGSGAAGGTGGTGSENAPSQSSDTLGTGATDPEADTDGDGDSGEDGDSGGWVTTTYDLVADWSNETNPFGEWSVRAGDVIIPSLIMDWDHMVGQPAWALTQSAPGHVPSFFRVAIEHEFFHDLLIGDVAMHAQDEGSGPDNGEGRIVWTSPAAGKVDIEGTIWLGRNIGRSDDWKLSVAGSVVAHGTVYDGDPYSRDNPMSFLDGATSPLTDLPVAPGSEVVLEISETTPWRGGEFAGVTATITHSVPE